MELNQFLNAIFGLLAPLIITTNLYLSYALVLPRIDWLLRYKDFSLRLRGNIFDGLTLLSNHEANISV